MPRGYRNKKTNKKRVYRRRRAPMTRKAVYAIANKAILRQAEVKKHRVAVQEVNLTINNATSVFNQEINTNILQGSSYSQIEGHILKGRNYTVRGLIHNNATVGVVLRISILNVKQGDYVSYQNGTALLETDSSNDNTLGTLIDCYKRYNLDQYKVIYDRVYKLAPASTTNADNFMHMKWNFKCPFKYRFDGANVNPVNNKLIVLMMARSANNDVELTNCEVTLETNFYYSDL